MTFISKECITWEGIAVSGHLGQNYPTESVVSFVVIFVDRLSIVCCLNELTAVIITLNFAFPDKAESSVSQFNFMV